MAGNSNQHSDESEISTGSVVLTGLRTGRIEYRLFNFQDGRSLHVAVYQHALLDADKKHALLGKRWAFSFQPVLPHFSRPLLISTDEVARGVRRSHGARLLALALSERNVVVGWFVSTKILKVSDPKSCPSTAPVSPRLSVSFVSSETRRSKF